MIPIDPNKPNAYVFDIDKTIAYHTNRGPFDYKKMMSDEPILGIKNILLSLSANNYIILLTGRPERVRDLTEKWLKENGFKYNCLIMKEGNEYQKSAITKKDSIESVLEDYNVLAVFEDSPSCVEAYANLGLVVCQIHSSYEQNK